VSASRLGRRAGRPGLWLRRARCAAAGSHPERSRAIRTQSSRVQSKDRHRRIGYVKTGSHQEPVPFVRYLYLERRPLRDPEAGPESAARSLGIRRRLPRPDRRCRPDSIAPPKLRGLSLCCPLPSVPARSWPAGVARSFGAVVSCHHRIHLPLRHTFRAGPGRRREARGPVLHGGPDR
jgi:hypothetical protein